MGVDSRAPTWLRLLSYKAQFRDLSSLEMVMHESGEKISKAKKLANELFDGKSEIVEKQGRKKASRQGDSILGRVLSPFFYIDNFGGFRGK